MNYLRNYNCAELANQARNRVMAKVAKKLETYVTPDKEPYDDSTPWRGITKTMEEASELITALAKLTAYPDGEYPGHDGKVEHILDNVIEELTDARATQDYFMARNGITINWERYRLKMECYEAWGLAGVVTDGYHGYHGG